MLASMFGDGSHASQETLTELHDCRAVLDTGTTIITKENWKVKSYNTGSHSNPDRLNAY